MTGQSQDGLSSHRLAPDAMPSVRYEQRAPLALPHRSVVARAAGWLLRLARAAAGLHSFLRNEDRRILEHVIFPYFQDDPRCRDVLFVGCDWYTKGYSRWFASKHYYTLDIDSRMRRFGAERHIVDGLQNISLHFPTGSLDVIFCNGVFGWGLDAPEDVDRAIRGCHDALRPCGWLVLGVDDVEERRPIALENCHSLCAFMPCKFPPLNTANFRTDTSYGHRFIFLRKPAQANSHSGQDHVRASHLE